MNTSINGIKNFVGRLQNNKKRIQSPYLKTSFSLVLIALLKYSALKMCHIRGLEPHYRARSSQLSEPFLVGSQSSQRRLAAGTDLEPAHSQPGLHVLTRPPTQTGRHPLQVPRSQFPSPSQITKPVTFTWVDNDLFLSWGVGGFTVVTVGARRLQVDM